MKTNFQLVRLLLVGISLGQLGLTAASREEQDTREVTLNFDVNEGQLLVLDASNTDVTIDTWAKSSVQLDAKVVYKGEPSDKISKFLDEFATTVADKVQESGSRLEVSTDLEVPNKVQIGGKLLGVQISYGRDEIEIYYDLKVPASMPLDIKNSYRDLLVMGNHSAPVKINHYSGDLRADTFDELNLILKYGKANIGKVETGRFELYEQKLDVDRVGSVEMDAKYSEVSIRESDILDLISYESEYDLNLCDKIVGELKYTQIVSREDISTIDFRSTYESDMELASVYNFIIDESRYSEIEIGSIHSLTLTDSYEDNLEIGTLRASKISSKYLELDVQTLTQKLLIDGYESDIEINEITKDLEAIGIDGKYNSLNLMTDGAPINITANLTYGSIDFDERKFDRKLYIKEDSKIEMELVSKQSATDTPTIQLLGYELKAIIN